MSRSSGAPWSLKASRPAPQRLYTQQFRGTNEIDHRLGLDLPIVKVPMVPKLKLSPRGQLYLWGVIAIGIVVVAHSIWVLYHQSIGYEWFVIAALTLISGSATVRLPSSYASISISETFVFTAVLLFGPAAGTVVVALDGLVISFWIAKRHSEPHRALFNMSAPAVSVWCSANLFFLIAKISPLVDRPASINAILPALIVFSVVYFALNSWLITFIIALERGLSPIKIWSQSFLWWSMNYICGASVAILFVGFNRTIDLGYVGLILPLLLVLYATFKTSMGRVEDAESHVNQMNRLYLSTIETLAMAIDAKDQVTHGHIRRVQLYATGLAREVGVRDASLLKAIEAAALLHDMGKLAVPEYILNKPGRLTDTEFEKMKLHASVGADILSAIEFPYPVVPIVRHHHENWDGTGYPDGLKATDIPVGARILAVVDCFDALTSDRPYRPRLSDEDALQILIERRGRMYDPLIVDTFTRVHKAIAPQPIESGVQSSALHEIAKTRDNTTFEPSSPVLAEISAGAEETLALYDLARALGGQVKFADAGDIVAKHLKRLIPSTLAVFYVYDETTDELEAKHAVGDGTSVVRGMRIRVGQRLSGWVAANKRTIANSDPILDLGDAGRTYPTRFRSCISTPLVSEDKLVGVLTIYSGETTAYGDDHRRIIEVVGRQVAPLFSRAIEFEQSAHRDPLTGLPRFHQIDQLTRATTPDSPAASAAYGLLFIDVVEMKMINHLHGGTIGDEALRHVVFHARRCLRVTDILFRNADDAFIAFLNDTDSSTANLVADRIRRRLVENPLFLEDGTAVAVEATVTCVCAPHDGSSVAELLGAARLRLPSTENRQGRSVH
jgi:diguanylate cyclase (GGDEF)-like protein/putative nucleotidyltransferase with HDIG domain